MDSVVSDTAVLDIAIIGSGPAGLSAAARAAERGLRCVVLERAAHLADTVWAYQKRKLVMAEPAVLPQRGPLPFAAGSREAVLDAWRRHAEDLRLPIELGQNVVSLRREASGLLHLTSATGRTWTARHVVVAVGTRGNPRRLGVPGEELPHVADRLVDPDAHVDEEIVVVGAGDSALEIALALCTHNRVHLIVRTPEIVRAKEALEREVLGRRDLGQLQIHFSTTVQAIAPGVVDLQGAEGQERVAADRLIKAIGADPPRRLLERWGLDMTGPGHDARPSLGAHYESTSLPGVHLVGAVTGRDLIKLGINQGFEVVEAIAGEPVPPADEDLLCQRLTGWHGSAAQRLDTLRDALPVFQGADLELLREIFLDVTVHELADGEVIVRENDYTDSFLAISDGRVAVRKRGADGREHQVTELQAGNFFGEMGLLSGRRRNATVVASGPTRILELPRKAMLKLLHLAPSVRKEIDRAFLVRALRSFLFPTLPEGEIWWLAARARVARVERDEVIFREGDPADAFYLLRTGMVKLSRASGDREVILTYLVAGNYFGEGSLIRGSLEEGAPRTATVTAIFPSELVVLERDAFVSFLDAHPAERDRLLHMLEEKKLSSLESEAAGIGEVLGQLIETEAVIGTDVLIIDNHKCIRCGNCIAACEGVHDDGQARLSLTGDQVANLLLPNSCMQCENPLCMLDCPPDAIVRRPGGEILIKDTCIGCGNCATNCPYDNIFMVHPRKPSLTGRVGDFLGGLFGSLLGGGRERGHSVEQEVAVKCDLCRDVRGGPACVRSCPTGAALRLEPQDPEDLRRSVEELVDPGDLL
ncbi:MAG: cyclic nucleotide-binding domain-containing protein [Acidobacteriota bacterium]